MTMALRNFIILHSAPSLIHILYDQWTTMDARQEGRYKRRRESNLNDTETQPGVSTMTMACSSRQAGQALTNAASAAAAAYDSDEEPPTESIQDRLLWRLDPAESKSDWTIEIIVKQSKAANKSDGIEHDDIDDDNNAEIEKQDEFTTKVETYHVHVRDLTVGPRRSEYFVQLLRDGGRFAESQTKCSRIPLQALAAEAFPMLLDFVYSSERDDPVPFTTQNTTALYSLANYFGIRRLQYLAKQSWKTTVKVSAYVAETYYVHAAMLQEEQMLQAANRACKDKILHITKSSRLLQDVTHVDFWLDIAEDYHGDSMIPMPPEYSLHLSQLMAHFFRNAVHEPDVFLQLTSNTFLPLIHKDAAIPLLDAERRIALSTSTTTTTTNSMNHHEDANQHPSPPSSAPAADANLTNLQERCMQSIVSNWDKLNLDEDDAPTMQLLYQQSPLFLARLFCRTVSTAAQAVAATSTTTTSSSSSNNSNSRRIVLRHGPNRPTLDEHLEILLAASDSSTSSSDDDSILFDESSFSSNSSDSS